MRRFFLFCGAIWSIVRFAGLYFSLTGEVNPSGDLFTGFLIFTFGSVHAVMAAGYCMTGVYPRSYKGVLRLLAMGQIFAFLSDAALLILGTGFFGLFYSEYETFAGLPNGFSPVVAVVLMTVFDFLFLIRLLLLRDLPVVVPSGGDIKGDETVLPEVDEITLEEEE